MKTYTNPILCGCYPDPSICRVGEDYFLVNSTFAYFPGIPVFHSRNLVQWNCIGHALDRLEQLDLTGYGVSKGIFAPCIRFHKNIFYITCTLIDGKGNFVVTASSPRGPWSNPFWLPHVLGIDPCLFFDKENAWIIYNSIAPFNKPLYSGHRTIRMQSFDLHNLSTNGAEIILVNGGTDLSKRPRWIEGPHVFRKNNYYYLIAAEGGTGYDHSVVAFRSKHIKGPYVPCPNNPVLTQRHLAFDKHPITSTGHADLVETIAGEWHAVFLGCRPYDGDHYNTGRETFLVPVTWTDDGWPFLNVGEQKVCTHYQLPHPDIVSNNATALSGNFSIRDTFETSELDSQWVFLRTPREKWYELKQGKLMLQIRPDTCSGFTNPSFLGRRQQHLRCMATCELSFVPHATHEKAGLAIFQDENHFYYLCLSGSGERMVIELNQSVMMPADGCRMHVLHTHVPAVPPGLPIQLRICCDHQFYAFYWSKNNRDWVLIRDKVDATFLSTRTAGGFVGCMFALYGTTMGQPGFNEAQYNWFTYRGDDEIFYETIE